MRLILVGNYGDGNIGDDALRLYFERAFPEVAWTVLVPHARAGNEVPRLPFGIRSLFRPWWRTFAAVARSDGVVFGGGTLFTDIESVRACILWWWHAWVAWMLSKPIYLAFQGIGPFRTRLGQWCASFAVRHARFVSVRDAASLARVQAWGKNQKIVQTFDPVFSLIQKENIDSSARNVFVVIPRKNSDASFEIWVKNLVRQNGFADVRILSLQPNHPEEQHVCAWLQNGIPGAVIVPVRSLHDLEQGIADAGLVASHRYHGAIAALALQKDVRIFPQASDDKLTALQVLMDSLHDPAGFTGTAVSLVAQGEDELRKMLREGGGVL